VDELFRPFLKRLKKAKAPHASIQAVEAQIGNAEKTVRELEAEAATIDAAVYDLKAINPNVIATVDERTPDQIISSIAELGKTVTDALARLRTLLHENEKQEP
jgi:type I restriction enzyme M protein